MPDHLLDIFKKPLLFYFSLLSCFLKGPSLKGSVVAFCLIPTFFTPYE
jgi:hypothetical protein